MKAKERVMAVLRHEQPDIIPFSMYAENETLAPLALYEPWRKLLDDGLCLHVSMSTQAHEVKCPRATMNITHHLSNTSWSPVDILISMNKSHNATGTINTPVGKSIFKTKWKNLDLSDVLPWFPEDGYFIKNSEDYEVTKFLIEDAEYTPHYESIVEIQMVLGNHRIVSGFVPKSPFQSI